MSERGYRYQGEVMKKFVPLIFAIIFLAGCTGSTVKTDANNGISISRFAATPSEDKEGGLILFDAELENVGGTTARNVKVDLFGVENQWRNVDGSLVTSTLTKFGTLSLNPPNIQRQLPGGFRVAQWQIMTPDIPQGVSPALPVEVRVEFDYNTSGHLLIPVVSDQEFEIRRIKGQSIASPQIVNSNGPLKITIPERFSRFIIVETEDPSPTESVSLRIEFTNVGDGFPITEGDTGKITGTIEVFGPGAEFEDCLGATSGKRADLDNSEITTKLRDTQSVPVACTIKISKAQWGGRAEDSIQLNFNIFYRYFVRDSARVTVFGR